MVEIKEAIRGIANEILSVVEEVAKVEVLGYDILLTHISDYASEAEEKEIRARLTAKYGDIFYRVGSEDPPLAMLVMAVIFSPTAPEEEVTAKFYNADGSEWIPPQEPLPNYVHLEGCLCIAKEDGHEVTSIQADVTCPICRMLK